MDTKGRLVVGSHNSNEFITINHNEISQVNSVKELNRQICEICGDGIETTSTANGEPFVACYECAFPVCRPCYEYERREGNQVCPRCKTRYKRLKGSPRVEDDEEEDDIDDLENEFHIKSGTEITTPSELDLARVKSEIPLRTCGQEDDLAIAPSFYLGKRANTNPFLVSPKICPLRPMDRKKDPAAYGYGSISWKDRTEKNRKKQNLPTAVKDNGLDDDSESEDDIPGLPVKDEGRQRLSRKLPITSSKINPYRMTILLRIVILCLYFHYRILHPLENAYRLWLTAVICEIWFALSWTLDQLPKWFPVERETYLDRLSFRYEKEGKPSELALIDIFVTNLDPLKEPPLVTANTILSVLAAYYPVEKVACYVSDDGASLLTFEALSETALFARKWVPFCKKFDVEPRAPEPYFCRKVDYLADKVDQSFIRERRAMKREYEEFKVRINGLVSTAKKNPEDGWTMQDRTPWPSNNVRDHPSMIQVLLDRNSDHNTNGNDLPRLIYVSRDKKPSFNHHNKSGALNSLLRVSAIMSNTQYVLNIDCDHYINNSKALREAMCFMMDGASGKKISFVQFQQQFDWIDCRDVFFEANMKGLDGIQGPIYVGTGCVFRRRALYGLDGPKRTKDSGIAYNNCLRRFWTCFCCGYKKIKDKKSKSDATKMKKIKADPEKIRLVDDIEAVEVVQEKKDGEKSSEKKLGESPVFIASALSEDGGVLLEGTSSLALFNEAIHVISCGYEEKTDWGKEVGWIYSPVKGDILTGFKMHCRGWRSVYFVPNEPAFTSYLPKNYLLDRLRRSLNRAVGSIEIIFSRHCPIWYGHGCCLESLQRFSYINYVVYPITSIPLLTYCTLPAICLLTGKFIVPEISNYAGTILTALFLSIGTTRVLEMRWGRFGVHDWWQNQQFWAIDCVSSHFFALIQGLLKVSAGINTNFGLFSEIYTFKPTYLLLTPLTLLIINAIGIVVGFCNAISNGYGSWGPFFGRLMFATWVIVHLHSFLRVFTKKQERIPTIIVAWSLLLASVLSLSWIRINPLLASKDDIDLSEDCGLDCY